MNRVDLFKVTLKGGNFSGGEWTQGQGRQIKIVSPYTNTPMGQIYESSRADVREAVQAAKRALPLWSSVPIKERSQVLFKFREILLREQEQIANLASHESGKTLGEARAGLLKGIEVLEFALSLQNMDTGGLMEVSRGVTCSYRREPLGVVAGITPFNFPAMVPMWMIPIALVLGNAFVLKPSEKTPLTPTLIAKALDEAGLPPGVFSIVQGGRETVEAIIEDPDIQAIGFVGSSAVAESVFKLGSLNLKPTLALGGAKNHIILLPDAVPELVGQGIVDSFTGCAGQRCMAASALLAVGDIQSHIDQIVQVAKKKSLGADMGAIISKEALQSLHQAIEEAEKQGAKILLDGRKAKIPETHADGNWLGPTILDNVDPKSRAAREELFGPVLSIIRCETFSQALHIENSNPYGNAASVFTSKGAFAEKLVKGARAGMIGVNVGVPVPREPFSFGGLYSSKFGHGEITGPAAVEFWSRRKKVTVKWIAQEDQSWMS